MLPELCAWVRLQKELYKNLKIFIMSTVQSRCDCDKNMLTMLAQVVELVDTLL